MAGEIGRVPHIFAAPLLDTPTDVQPRRQFEVAKNPPVQSKQFFLNKHTHAHLFKNFILKLSVHHFKILHLQNHLI